MDKTRRILGLVFWAVFVVALVIIALFESNIIVSGGMAGEKNSEFMLMTVMELLTIIAMPVALRLFKNKSVIADIKEHKEKALLKWGQIRLSILGLPLIADALLYYLFMQATFGYLAIILAICMVFVFPSRDRCDCEVKIQVENETDCNNRKL